MKEKERDKEGRREIEQQGDCRRNVMITGKREERAPTQTLREHEAIYGTTAYCLDYRERKAPSDGLLLPVLLHFDGSFVDERRRGDDFWGFEE